MVKCSCYSSEQVDFICGLACFVCTCCAELSYSYVKLKINYTPEMSHTW